MTTLTVKETVEMVSILSKKKLNVSVKRLKNQIILSTLIWDFYFQLSKSKKYYYFDNMIINNSKLDEESLDLKIRLMRELFSKKYISDG
jgi:hypothetical protein